MKLVTFGQILAPYGVGDTCLVSDEKEISLRAEGVLITASEPWPAPSAAGAKKPSPRPIIRPTRPAGVPDRRQAR